MFQSIYSSYPFTEEWEKRHCRRVITEAMQWGDTLTAQNTKQKIKSHITMMNFYNGAK